MDRLTIGIDLAKSVFQISIANGVGRIVERRRLSRSQFQRILTRQPASLLVMEACASAHYWARTAQAQGHQVMLLHPRYVRPYVRRNKTDAADADALTRAVRDPDLKPVPVKSPDQQALQGLHRIRQQWLATRTQRINMVRGLLAEFGIVLPAGARAIVPRLRLAAADAPLILSRALHPIIDEIADLQDRVESMDAQLKGIAKENADAGRLLTVPGIGVITATALVASVPDIHAFKRDRSFASWLGLTPREYSSANTRRLGGISKRGDGYLRMMLVHGARSALLRARRQLAMGKDLSRLQRWALELETRAGHNKATVALANHMARIVWAIWTRGETYNARIV